MGVRPTGIELKSCGAFLLREFLEQRLVFEQLVGRHDDPRQQDIVQLIGVADQRRGLVDNLLDGEWVEATEIVDALDRK